MRISKSCADKWATTQDDKWPSMIEAKQRDGQNEWKIWEKTRITTSCPTPSVSVKHMRAVKRERCLGGYANEALCRWDREKKKKTENEQRTLQYKTQHEAKKAKFPNSKLKKISQKQSKKFTIFFCFWAETLDSALNVDKSFLDAMVIIFGPQPIRSSNPIQSKKSCGLLLLLA